MINDHVTEVPLYLDEKNLKEKVRFGEEIILLLRTEYFITITSSFFRKNSQDTICHKNSNGSEGGQVSGGESKQFLFHKSKRLSC